MSAYLEEAACLAAEVPQNRCPATDAIEWLDDRPQARLALEDTWTDPVGRVYREVPADRISRWPAHLARSFRAFLRVARDPDKVFKLLDLLAELDAGSEILRMTLARCRRRGTLDFAIDYYTNLVAELPTLPPLVEEVPLGGTALRCRPRFACGEAQEGTWYAPDGESETEDDPFVSPSHRAQLLHDPTSPSEERAWIQRQPRSWRRLYYGIRKADESRLQRLKRRLLGMDKETWSRDQLTVLWDAYRIRRDFLRKKRRTRPAAVLHATAHKLIRRIGRIRSRAELGFVGKRLYDALNGELRLPGSVSEREWNVIFEAYRARKANFLAKAS